MLVTETGYGAQKKDKEKKKDTTYSMTEAELQAQVMAFADRYSAVISSADREYQARSPSPQNRRTIRNQLVYSLADAFTIAAGPNPDAAFLDMVVMVTLGRMVFEEHYAKKYGRKVAPLVKGFQTAEKDIWQIADRVLTKQQQKELMAMIREWRRKHSDVIIFSYVRFSDFEKSRGISDPSNSKKFRGLFQSVANATQQVEEARLLAERGMYLGTRLPLMAGAFGDIWLSQWSANPDVKKILTDLHHLSGVSQSLAEVVEKLPDNVTAEREATVKQVMQEVDRLSKVTLDRIMQRVAKEREATVDQLVNRLSKERENAIYQIVEQIASERRRTIEDFLAEEKRMRGLLTDLKETLAAGNNVLTVTNTLVDRFNLGGATTPSEPFDIKDYQITLREASNVIQQLHGLVKTVDQMGLEKSLPHLIKTIDRIEQEGEEWVTHAGILGIIVISIFMIGAVLALLAYRYFSQRIFDKKRQQAVS
jgi:hypothetical protein